MPGKKKKPEPEHHYLECILNDIADELREIAQASKHGANELHLLRKSVQHIENIFDQGGQIGNPIITFGKPKDKI